MRLNPNGRFTLSFIFVITTVAAAASGLAGSLVYAAKQPISETSILIPLIAFAPLGLMSLVASFVWITRKLGK